MLLAFCLCFLASCGSSEDADDTKPTKDKSDNTPTPTDKKETVTVTFDLNYDDAATPTTETVEHGKTTTKPATPTRTNYAFVDWYTDNDMTKVFDFTTVITDNITLYAKWVKCPLRDARETLTHAVPLYSQGKADAPYVPEKLLGSFRSGSGETIYILTPQIPKNVPAGQENQLPYISPLSHLPSSIYTESQRTGNFEITPDYIDYSFITPVNNNDGYTLRISCYSVKQVNDNLYFYYGKVTFLLDGQESDAFNKSMYAWTGLDKRDPANKDALYGYMVSIQGDYLRGLYEWPFVGGKYTRASDNKTVIFPKTEAGYAALTLEDLNIIATVNPTSDLLFRRQPGPTGKGIVKPNN